MDNTKLLALSDHPTLNTGFSTITMNILNRLTQEYQYDCAYLGQAIPHPQQFPLIDQNTILKSWDFPPLLNSKKVPSVYLQDGNAFWFNLIGQAREPYCKDIIEPTIKSLRPDIFFTLLDTFMVHPWYLTMDFSPAKTVFYFPTDGEPYLPGGPNACELILKRMTKAVAMSKHGQRQVKEKHNIDAEYIPHAIDHNVFSPFTEEEKKLARTAWALQDKFVVGCVARNQPRKMMDRTLKAFAKFSKDKEDVVLLLHMDPDDVAAAFNMNLLIRELKIEHKVLYTGVKYFNGFTYTKMRVIYNLMDIFFLLTSGEGFGIPFIEAMACEVPVIGTNYTTAQEIIVEDGQCGEVVKLSGDDQEQLYSTLTGNMNVERGMADVADGTKMLNKLYYDVDLRKIYGKTGRKKVLWQYSWDVVMPQWHELFQRMVNE